MNAREQLVVSPGRILIVDDSCVVRLSLRGVFEKAGFLVDEAAHGIAARERIATGGYDVVVTDLRMPRLDGFGLMEAVGQRPESPEFIVLTGALADDVRAAVRALRLGAHDLFTKPIDDTDSLLLSTRAAVEKKRLRADNARLLRELDRLSRTDALTAVGNRRAFDDTMRGELTRARRYGLPLSLLLVDVDHFKRVNDTHGHVAGDAALRWLAGVMSAWLREGDGLFRYGGEEFAALLPHTPLRGALDVAERLVAGVAAAPCPWDATELRLTCSAGVATHHGSDPGRPDLVARADRALYAAKKAGRDRAVADSAPRIGTPRRLRAAS